MRKVLLERRISSMRTSQAGHLVNISAFCDLRFVIGKCLYTVPALCNHTKLGTKFLCVSSSPPVAQSERAARHAGMVHVPRLVVWHSFHISSLTRSCVFRYIPLFFPYRCSNTVLRWSLDPRDTLESKVRLQGGSLGYPPLLSTFLPLSRAGILPSRGQKFLMVPAGSN